MNQLLFFAIYLTEMNKFVIVVLLSSFGAIEASNQVPNQGSLTITKTIVCLRPVGDTAEPEEPPLFPLVPGTHLCSLVCYDRLT